MKKLTAGDNLKKLLLTETKNKKVTAGDNLKKLHADKNIKEKVTAAKIKLFLICLMVNSKLQLVKLLV